MTFYNKVDKCLQYKKIGEDVIEIRETEEQIVAMDLQKIRDRVKFYADKYTESDYQLMKNNYE